MTDTLFTLTGLTAAAEKAGITPDQARTILEAAGVKVEPEKPALPTDPESVITATEVRGVTGKWRMMLDDQGEWVSPEAIGGWRWHEPHHITAWTDTVVLPVTAAPVTLTEDQVGEEWDQRKNVHLPEWAMLSMASRSSVTTIFNAALAQHAAPAEDMPDWDDVRNAVASQRGNGWSLNDDAINGITDAVMRLLHREDQP